jgi:hypothetical protein
MQPSPPADCAAPKALVRKHRIVHGILVPLAHRLRGYKTVHFELTPIDGGAL